MPFTTAQLRIKGKQHIDQVVERQIVARALDNVNCVPPYVAQSKNVIDIVDFFNDIPNLQVLTAKENNKRRNAGSKFLNKATEADVMLTIRDKWSVFRATGQLPPNFKKAMHTVLNPQEDMYSYSYE